MRNGNVQYLGEGGGRGDYVCCTIVEEGGGLFLSRPFNRIWVRRAVGVCTESCAENFVLSCPCRLYHVTSKVKGNITEWRWVLGDILHTVT